MAKPHSKKEAILLDSMQEDKILAEIWREKHRCKDKDWKSHKRWRREINRKHRREPIEEE